MSQAELERATLRVQFEGILSPAIDAKAPYAKVMIDRLVDVAMNLDLIFRLQPGEPLPTERERRLGEALELGIAYADGELTQAMKRMDIGGTNRAAAASTLMRAARAAASGGAPTPR